MMPTKTSADVATLQLYCTYIARERGREANDLGGRGELTCLHKGKERKKEGRVMPFREDVSGVWLQYYMLAMYVQ